VTDARQNGEVAVLDALGDLSEQRDRCREVLVSGDGEDRCVDLGEAVGDVEASQGGADLGVPDGVDLEEAPREGVDDVWPALCEALGEPALQRPFDQCLGPLACDQQCAFPPRCRVPIRAPVQVRIAAEIRGRCSRSRWSPTAPPTESPA